ncbi:MAG: transcription-repair coupling factor [Candidatus Solincola sediminis]|uniref:Transcription-repair-coupling factor n=1 Tax=Candidatus Solincola sediminis TaxID=1797199 RepID=A0A1F2WLI5_9ACTN|nr:MAG: transcription-repair coupling factor [Candidatus Solincola sediminis]
MEIYNIIKEKIEKSLKPLLGEGMHVSIQAEEEIHPFLVAYLAEASGRQVLVVAPGRQGEENIALLIGLVLGESRVRELPLRELVIAGERGEDGQAVSLRARALRGLSRGEKAVVVTEAMALAQHYPAVAKAYSPLSLKVGRESDLEEAARSLERMGYEREYLVEGAGQFSVRGGILDAYDPGRRRPVRAEFFGDRVERIRTFNPLDQRSQEILQEIEIYPVALPDCGRDHKGLLDFLDPSAIVVSLQPLLVREKLARAGGDGLTQAAAERGLSLIELDPMALHPNASVKVTGGIQYRGRLPDFLKDLKDLLREGWKALILIDTEGRRDRLRELLVEEGIAVNLESPPSDGVATLSRGTWSRGFKLSEDKLAVFTEPDIFGMFRLRAPSIEGSSRQPVEGWWDLEEGDYVVHVNHGIAVYGGLVEREVDGAVREYLLLKYKGGDSLYVPTDRIDLVHRYVGAENPTIYSLSGHHWTRVKRRARHSVREMAMDLLNLYADRIAGEGHAFGADDPWQRELETSFPYRETADQERAIAEVKEDMEKPRVMDRLVYGDVGYGKTEVGVRAAFKAIMDGKQVAVLVPTTVLAQQHYRTFSERFEAFPVRVEMLSRFITAAGQRAVLEAITRGEVDIVIGTQRLLSGDVNIPNLGLVIIDEEHRFGVAQKERLKALRRSVDVLTLSATPIPRTLQMSLSGIRDMSVIDTPIEDRYSVITSVGPYEDELVREAIRREIKREGQVFYVHNRVQTIERTARHVRELVPEARVVIGHGQMNERKLEEVMEDFIEQRSDVLVCTTIVESGLDIPNVNTLIVDGAENLGLSQLYHLRGRIGRSNRQAYAFYLFRDGRAMTDGALQRLKVIRDFSELGSGLRIAMKDLEIRGAGNLLGSEQHGHVEAVGFELYCRMLAEAVDEMRGVKRTRTSQVTIDLPIHALITDEYVQKTARRIEIYRRLAEAGTAGEIDEIAEETRDRYGPLPGEAENLFEVARLRLDSIEIGIREIGHDGDEVVLRLNRKGVQGVDGIWQEASTEGCPWTETRYHKTLHEIALQFPAGSWFSRGRENLGQLRRFLEAIPDTRKGESG